MLLEAIKFVTEQDKAPKDTLFLFHLLFQSNLDLKFSDSKQNNVTRGGVRKALKKCHVLFEWPHTSKTQRKAEINDQKRCFKTSSPLPYMIVFSELLFTFEFLTLVTNANVSTGGLRFSRPENRENLKRCQTFHKLRPRIVVPVFADSTFSGS